MGMVATLVMWPDQFATVLAYLSQGVFIWNFTLIGLVVPWKTMF